MLCKKQNKIIPVTVVEEKNNRFMMFSLKTPKLNKHPPHSRECRIHVTIARVRIKGNELTETSGKNDSPQFRVP